MRRSRRRPMHYSVHSLCDGVIIAAVPVRKLIPNHIQRTLAGMADAAK